MPFTRLPLYWACCWPKKINISLKPRPVKCNKVSKYSVRGSRQYVLHTRTRHYSTDSRGLPRWPDIIDTMYLLPGCKCVDWFPASCGHHKYKTAHLTVYSSSLNIMGKQLNKAKQKQKLVMNSLFIEQITSSQGRQLLYTPPHTWPHLVQGTSKDSRLVVGNCGPKQSVVIHVCNWYWLFMV